MAAVSLVSLSAAPKLRAQDDKALTLRANVVKISSTKDGFGFVVAEHEQQLLVVTAEHVILGENNPGASPQGIGVVFFTDQSRQVPARLLVKDDNHDLALLEVNSPAGFTWQRQCLAQAGGDKRDTDVWFVGRDAQWYVPPLKGAISTDGPDADGWLQAEMPTLRPGSSGGPLVTRTGIVGMVMAGNAEDVRVLSAEYIEKKVQDWKYPWDLTAEGGPAPPAVATEAQQHFERGTQLGSMGDWDGAIREQQKAVELKPDYAEAHRELGVALEWKNDWDGAIKEEQAALQLKPDYAEAHHALGVALGAKGRWDEVIKEEQAAIRLKPDDADEHWKLGVAYGSKGNWDEEIKEQQAAIKLKPDYAEAHHELGIALDHKNDWDGDLAEQQKAIQIKWDYPEAHVERGVALSWENDWIGFLLEEQEAAKLKPDYANAHRELGVAYEWRSDWDSEIKEEQEAIRLDPNDAISHYRLGTGFGNKANWDEEIKEQQAAVKLNPDYVEAHYQLGVALENKGDREAALQEYSKAHSLDQNNTTYLGSFERLQGQLRKQ